MAGYDPDPQGRLILPPYARPGVGARDSAAAPRGCSFLLTALDDLIWSPCALHAHGADLHRFLRAWSANVDGLPPVERGALRAGTLYALARDIRKSIEAAEGRER